MIEQSGPTAQTEQDDFSFVRTGDNLCLTCLPVIGGSKRHALRAMSFGNRICFLEEISPNVACPDIASCVFVLEQAISLRALQERFNQESKFENIQQTTAHAFPTKQQSTSTAQVHSFRTLLYGHAVLLRHLSSTLYLSCLSTSTSNDKLAFDVGLEEGCEGESVWFTVHPASKQRSEGEKVRFNDDIILVSVFSERYLHAYMSSGDKGHVNASFRQQIWSIVPIINGLTLMKNHGYVFGGDIVRLFHANMDQCVSCFSSDASESGIRSVFIRGAPSSLQACSLWRIEPFKIKWHGGFIGIGERFRLRHVTTGEFLSIIDSDDGKPMITTLPHIDTKIDYVSFEFSLSKEKVNDELSEQDGMGSPVIKCGETLVYIRHTHSGLWLTYDILVITLKGIGKVEEKKLSVSEEGHMDDCFKLVKAQHDESRSAVIIRISTSTLREYQLTKYV
ncbi:hypothetical protein GJ496_001978 [Pomphorhynchus laevis]|nr:hypothetical protein GJ496_001978 [Pomphorhynchus laevis]